MVTLRIALLLLAALVLCACASAPPAASMTLTPVPCGENPGYDCAGEIPDYSDVYYGTAYANYPVLVPIQPIVTPPPAPVPVKPLPPPLPSPPPAPKVRLRPPLERPCPKSSKVCP